MMPRLFTCLSIVAAFALGACSLGGLFAPPEAKTYDLTAPQDFKMGGRHRRNLQLIVPEPTALRWLDTDKITVKPNAAEINYLGESQWSDRLPRLFQARLIETLERTGRFRAVTRPGSGIDPDYQVLVEIRNFEIIAGDQPQAHVNVSVKLVPAKSGRSIAERVFEAYGPAAGTDAVNATAALNAAMGDVLKNIAVWASAR